MGQRVQRIRTTVSEPQMAQAIIEGWKTLFNSTPSKEQVSLILAQNALETANRKSMWNYNIGNITTDGKGSSNFFDDLTTDEQIKPGKWEKKNLKYKSYNSLQDGVNDYLKLMSTKDNYKEAWKHIISPNPIEFSKGLKAGGYYTANEAPYTKQILKLFKQINNSNSYELAQSGNILSPTQQNINKPINDINTIINNYLRQVAASNYFFYKTIEINGNNLINNIEFARILSLAYNKILNAKTSIHKNNESIELEVKNINNIDNNIYNKINNIISQNFDNISINIINKKSSADLLSPFIVESAHRQFIFNIIKGS